LTANYHDENNDYETNERRSFPRTDVECPILYLIGTDKQWRVAILINMSAIGLQMKCKEPVSSNTKISIQIKPGSNKIVPKITGDGVVVRCDAEDDGSYRISCKLTRIDPPK
jgi:hypothetical protein